MKTNIYQVKDGIHKVNDYFSLNRKIMVVTDEGIPNEYSDIVMLQCLDARLHVIPSGEASKSFSTLEKLLEAMSEWEMCREDAVIALGGGVVGDLAGLAAGLYMRGIDYYNIPTSLLAQVDSSVGGKTAINLSGVKNIVGLFHQPKGVLIDTNLLKSLPERQYKNGMVEVLKMGMILDEELVNWLEKENYKEYIDEIVERSIALKSQIVEQDETEKNIRSVLNYGHTIGHGIESAFLGELLHGEAVACGMLAVSEGEIYVRIENALENLGVLSLVKNVQLNLTQDKKEKIKNAIVHDKKGGKNGCKVVVVTSVGQYEIVTMPMEDIFRKVDGMTYEK